MGLQECREKVAIVINEYVNKNGFEQIKTNEEIRNDIIGNKVELDVMFQEPDMCYNKTNKANLKTYSKDVLLFEQVGRGKFRILGENYPYSGDVIWKHRDGKEEIVGKWDKGNLNYWVDSIVD